MIQLRTLVISILFLWCTSVHHGRSHIHGIVWLEGAPDISELDRKSFKERAVIANYFGNLVTTMNPHIGKPIVHPNQLCKIVLPNKLRYLENMLNSEVVAKAAKIRQRIENNPGTPDNDKGWPMLLAKYQEEKKEQQAYNFKNLYKRRFDKF